MKKVILNYINIFLIKLCCAYCYYKNIHSNHKILEISDIETLKKGNINIDHSKNEFNEISQKINLLKEKIENEINKIN